MTEPREEPDPDELSKSSRESIDKARDLVDGMKTVQEHETSVLGEDEAPPGSSASTT